MDSKYGWQLLYLKNYFVIFLHFFAIFIFLYYTYVFCHVFFSVFEMPVGDNCRDVYVEKHFYSFLFYSNGFLICIKCLLMLNRKKEYITFCIMDLS